MNISENIIPENEADRLSALKRYEILDTPPDKSFDRIAALAARLLKVPIAIVSLVDSDRIWFKSRYGFDAVEIPRSPGLCASAILHDRPWIVDNATIDPRTLANPLVAGEVGLRFYAAAPLRTTDGYNLGTLCVIDKEPRKLSDDDVDTLMDLADLVMNEMELRLATRRALRSELMVRKQQLALDAAILVSESEERRHFALDSARIGDWDLDLRSNKMRRSLVYDQCFGYPYGAPEWDTDIFIQHVHPDDLHLISGVLDNPHCCGGVVDAEFRVIWPDRSIHWLLMKGRFYFDEDGAPIRMSGICSEITERKENEQKIARLGLVVEKTTTPMMITDAKGRIEWVNGAFKTLTGYSMEEVVGIEPKKFLQGPGTNPATVRRMRDAIEHQRGFEVEILNYHKSGHPFWLHIKADPILDKSGKVESYIAVQSDITDRKNLEIQLWKRANFDTLTGLPNRHLFWDRLDHEVKHAHRTNKPAALFFIDLDRFKEINDWFGHEIGDKLLKEAAERITSCVREADTVARIGGDEFTVILTELDSINLTATIAKNILSSLSRQFVFDKANMNLSASIGIAIYPFDTTKAEELLKYADQAMYLAKSCGRNQFCYFTQLIQEKAQRRLHLGLDLRHALARNQLEVHFQPIVSLATGRIAKAESLLRWNHHEKGLIEPSEFIPLAEELGLINEIGEWVFYKAASCANRWNNDRSEPIQISINKSALQFEGRSHSQSWPQQLMKMGYPCNQISIEITEGVLLKDSSKVMETLLEYREAGIEIALDDFGTGYSSMSYLSKFNIDYLKIDQSFVRDITTSSSRTIAETIIVMGHKLGLKIIAEGIETEEQRRILETAGCDYGQGYLFSEAVPQREFERLLEIEKH